MAKPPKAKFKLDGPPQSAWLFGDRAFLPDDESLAAFYWEFALETPEAISEVQEVRKTWHLARHYDATAMEEWCAKYPKPKNDGRKWIEWMARFREQFPSVGASAFRDYNTHFLTSWPEFPSQHWLEIPKRGEKRRDKNRLHIPSADALVWGEGLKGEESRGKFGTVPVRFFKTDDGLGCSEESADYMKEIIARIKYLPTTKTSWGATTEDRWTEYRLVSLNWARSDRKLKADFAEWLKENRPDDRQPFYKTEAAASRRTNERDLLKALGAFRLLRHFKGDSEKAAEWSQRFCKDKKGIPKSLYEDESAWRDAERRAKAALEKFFTRVFG